MGRRAPTGSRVANSVLGRLMGSTTVRSIVTRTWETAETVRYPIRRLVSRQQICLDGRWQAGRTTVWTSRFGVDRIAAGEIDFSAVSWTSTSPVDEIGVHWPQRVRGHDVPARWVRRRSLRARSRGTRMRRRTSGTSQSLMPFRSRATLLSRSRQPRPSTRPAGARPPLPAAPG